jgi:hypothetical protein
MTASPSRAMDGKVQKAKVFRPRPEFGEDDSRQNWGEVVNPKKTMKFKPGSGKADREAGCPYTPVELKEFNPGSRPQIIDRLTKVYEWVPQEFTETGQPAVNDEVLRDLAHSIPICDELAELFYYNKRLGQLVDGKNGWIGKSEERGDGRIHATFNVGGTVTNRASHANPNIAQVPRVVFKKLKQWVEPASNSASATARSSTASGEDRRPANEFFDENLTPLLGPDGKQVQGTPKPVSTTHDASGDGDFEGLRRRLRARRDLARHQEDAAEGPPGDHGWDCRNLFYVPDGWVLMGADQKGIELRALGHFMAEFDDGVYGRSWSSPTRTICTPPRSNSTTATRRRPSSTP